MSLETGTYISDLVATNPQGTDPKSQGDDHLRLIKDVLKNSLPTLNAPLSAALVPFTPVGGVAATNVQAAIAELDTEKAPASTGVPAGAIMDFAMSVVPAGWLECNGVNVSRTTYAALFAAIGTTWGSGDGSTTFTLPDARGRYRAMGGTDGTSESKTFGHKLGDAIRNITGSTSAAYRAAQVAATGALSMSAYGSTPAKVGAQGVDSGDSASINFDASGSVPTANENRPYSIVVQTCIKV